MSLPLPKTATIPRCSPWCGGCSLPRRSQWRPRSITMSAGTTEKLVNGSTPASRGLSFPILVNGCTGKMGRAVAEAAVTAGLQLLPISFSSQENPGRIVQVGNTEVQIHGLSERESVLSSVFNEFPDVVVVDYTVPDAVNGNAELYCKVGVPFVMGTTGGDRQVLYKTVQDANVYAVISPQMGKQVVAFLAAMEIMADQFPGAFSGYTLQVMESHQATKLDTSGTAKAVISCFNKLGVPFDLEQTTPHTLAPSPRLLLAQDDLLTLRTRTLSLPLHPEDEYLELTSLTQRPDNRSAIRPTCRLASSNSWTNHQLAPSSLVCSPAVYLQSGRRMNAFEWGRFRIQSSNIRQIQKIRDPQKQLEMVGVPEEHLSGHAFHLYHLTSPDQTVSFEFQHNVCGRSIYAEGSIDAAIFLHRKVQSKAEKKIYDMIDVLREGNMR